MANIAAEFGLLAGLAKNPDIYFNIQQHLSVNDFNDKAHKELFTVLQRLILNSTNNITILVTKVGLMAEATALGMKNFYETCRDGELLDACLDHEVSSEDTLRAFAQVKRETVKSGYGEMIKRMSKYLHETNDSTTDIIQRVDNDLMNLSNKLQGVVDDEIIRLPDRTKQVLMELADHPGELGVNIGFPQWQRAIGGVRNGSISFVAATAKAGKSQWGARAALEISEHIPVLYCDSELNETVQQVRAFGMFGEINYEILETGYWNSEEAKILADGYDRTFATQCRIAKNFIDDPEVWREFHSRKFFYKNMTGMTAREMLPFLRRWVLQHAGKDRQSRVPRCMIVWDYIKLARVDEVAKLGVGAHDVIGDTCMALHDFAEEYNLPILAFGQTNRSINRDINMIAGAKKIVELVDSVTLWHKKDAEDLARDPTGTHEVHVLATRYGKGVSTHINVSADLSIGKFKELGIAKLPQQTPTAQLPQPKASANTSKNSNDDDN